MSHGVRLLLVWILALALPLQGMAASLMLHCGPVSALERQGFAPASAPGAGHRTQAQSDVPAHAPCHDHPGSGLAVAPDASAQGAAHDEGGGSVMVRGKLSCSACAACCSMMAMPSEVALPQQPELALALSLSPPVPMSSHLPDTLDPPPRLPRP